MSFSVVGSVNHLVAEYCPEAVRSASVSGCKFNPLVKDSDRGGLVGIMRLVVKKARVPDAQAEGWVRALVDYCDGFAFHGTPEKLAADAHKRNHLQSQGWLVLTFWGQTILRNPDRCEEQIWRAFTHRRTP